MTTVATGDIVRCIDATSRPDWADWYMDQHYAEDLLVAGKLYVVQGIAERDGQTGYDVGVSTPWGDPHWNSQRFEPALMLVSASGDARTATEVDHV
jgi:hypothetical protein